MEKQDGKALKAGIWYLISNFITKGLVFLTIPIFTRILSKQEFGQYSNFITWQNLLMIIVTLELYSTVMKARFDFNDQIEQYLSTIIIAGTGVTIVCYGVVIAFKDFFVNLFGIEEKYIHILFIYLMVAPALQTLQAKYRIYLKYRMTVFLTMLSSVGSVLFAVLLVSVMEDKLFGRIFGQQFVMVAVNLVLYVLILYQGKCFKWEYCKYALGFAIPLVPHLLAGNLLGSSDKIMIEKLCGSEDLALYSVAYNCALMAKVLMDSLNQAMIPWLFEKLNSNDEKEIKHISQIYFSIFMLLALGMMLLMPEVILIFGGGSYKEAKFVMPPIIMGLCFQFTYTMYVNIEFYLKKTLNISIGTIGAALVNIILNYIAIKNFGYGAAAYTTMISYGFLLYFHYFIVKKYGLTVVYKNRYNAKILAVMTVITVIMEFVYMKNVARLIFLILYCLLCIGLCNKYKDEMKKILMAVKKGKGRRTK